MRAAERPAAVVLGLGLHGLGIVRSLAKAPFPLAVYSHLARLDLDIIKPPPAPVIWCDSVGDTLAARQTGDAAMPPGRVVDAYFRLDDPGPSLARFKSRVVRKLAAAMPMRNA